MARQSRFRTGLALAKISWHTLRNNKGLMAFPIAGLVSALIIGLVFVVPGVLLLAMTNLIWVAIILFAISAYLAAFVGVYFGVALCAAADRVLRGGQAKFSDGTAVAHARIPQIAKWALMIITVAFVINLIQSQFEGAGGAITGALAGVAWSLASFLAIPVITFEEAGPITALKRSASLFRERWGQQVTGRAITSGVVALFTGVPGIALCAIGAFMLGNDSAATPISAGATATAIALIVVGMALIIIGSVLAGALNNILSVALYHYAATGEAVGAYSQAQLEGVVAPRTQRGMTA